MALRTFHPCPYNFRTSNIRRVGNVLDGGISISGFQDDIETTGGGRLQADFTGGSTRDKMTGNAWRALADMDGGEVVDVLLCAERLFQPVGAIGRATHSDGTPFSDGSEYVSIGGASYSAVADADLRSTTMTIASTATLDLIGGELFSILHPNWGWRAYRVRSIDGSVITFRTPLREAITAGTVLDFNTPRCRMRRLGQSDNSTEQGRYTACAISFGEDMRPPS